MEYIYNFCERFILDNRWLFDVELGRIVDLESRVGAMPLKPVAARILALLARSPQVLLRRREIFKDGWNRFGFEVCENSLNQVICTLRNNFEKLDPGRPYIKTVPRIGYCLLVEARPVATSGPLKEIRHVVAETDFARSGIDNRLVGRRTFEQTADIEWRRAHRSRLPLSALRIEVNPLEEFRSHGNELADEALMRVAQCVRKNLNRAGDSVTRCNDNALAVLMAHTDEVGAVQVGKRIAAAVHAIDWSREGGRAGGLTISIVMVCSTPGRFPTLQTFLNALEGSPDKAEQLAVAKSFG